MRTPNPPEQPEKSASRSMGKQGVASLALVVAAAVYAVYFLLDMTGQPRASRILPTALAVGLLVCCAAIVIQHVATAKHERREQSPGTAPADSTHEYGVRLRDMEGGIRLVVVLGLSLAFALALGKVTVNVILPVYVAGVIVAVEWPKIRVKVMIALVVGSILLARLTVAYLLPGVA